MRKHFDSLTQLLSPKVYKQHILHKHKICRERESKRKKERSMESSGEMVAFPLLITPIENNYRASTIPYRFPSDNPNKPTPIELSWINLFANSIPSFKKRAESDDTVPDAPAKAEKFAQRYGEILEDFKKDPESHGGPPDCILLCRIRELILREVGFRDIFKKVKEEENAKAISLFKDVVNLNDAIEEEPKRVENLVRGIFAGNIFDLGSATLAELFSKDGMSFLASCQNIVPRPWVIDDLDAFIAKWSKKPWKKAVIFVDNSGADIILGILPFARELLRRGTQVVLAANDLPSINDVTYHELLEIISKLKDENGKLMGVDTQNLLIANSGNDLPVIDLSSVSQELAYLASDADLVVLEGMGRGIETNLYAQFKCDSLKIGMVKHPEVAQFLGGRLYDCVFKFNEVSSG
ncbi:putative damage-control phosphatase ARMT1-like, metal-binding domain, AF1104-like superfamily [Helianthus debilis subsp. tardiflorus]